MLRAVNYAAGNKRGKTRHFTAIRGKKNVFAAIAQTTQPMINAGNHASGAERW